MHTAHTHTDMHVQMHTHTHTHTHSVMLCHQRHEQNFCVKGLPENQPMPYPLQKWYTSTLPAHDAPDLQNTACHNPASL